MTAATRQLLAERAPYRTASGRRIRTLYRCFVAKLDADDPIHVALALRAAETLVAAEQARTKLLQAPDFTKELEESVTRLDNVSRRAAEELAPLQVSKPKTETLREFDESEF
jgi:hypothetical protein